MDVEYRKKDIRALLNVSLLKEGKRVHTKWILLIISIAIIVCPIGGALLAYRDDLQALVVPETPEFISETPEITYLDQSISANVIKLRFKFVNPYSANLTISSIDAEIFCVEHDVILGYANETAPVAIASKANAIITLALNFNTQAETHFLTQHTGETAVNIELRNLEVEVQGVKIRYTQAVGVGSMPIP